LQRFFEKRFVSFSRQISWEWIWKSFHQETSILILGLDSAGKTAILYSLQLGEAISYTIPTVGFNVEEIEIEHLKIKMWDIGGQDKIRALWPHYYQQSHGMVFVVDSNDVDRFDQARDELHAIISHKDNVGKPLLVLANKQDLPHAANKEELAERLALTTIKSSKWFIIECSATLNQRAKLGFEWLAQQL
jgi:ADP-ribosylation factor protein 1